MMKKLASFLSLTLVASALISATPNVANAANSVPTPLTENFVNSTMNDPGKWVASATGDQSFPHPCLTALSKNSSISLANGTSIPGCGTNSPEANGSGALILTTANAQQTATMLYNNPLPTSGGMEIAFYTAMYGGTNADGLSFFTKDGSNTSLATGVAGGGLGYKGLPGALFGVGFDRFGNWMNSSGSMDSACPAPTVTPYAIAVRGADSSATQDGSVGYCVLGGGAVDPGLFGLSTDNRTAAARPVRIIVDPSTATTPKIHIYVWKTGDPNQPLNTANYTLEVDEPAQYKAASTFKFGFSASTGGANNFHAIWGLSIKTFVPEQAKVIYVVPQNSSVNAGDAASYSAKYYSDLAHTSEISTSTLSNFVPSTCTSSYTLATSGPTTLPITCSGGAAALYSLNYDATATLTVNKGTPKITPATQTLSGTTGSAITASATYTPTNFTATPTYAISPALPAGLSFNTANGVITGTPTAAASVATYTVTATNGSENATATISLTVVKATPAITPATQTINGVTGTAITATATFVAVNFAANPTYTISPALPAGLSIASSSGVITGTPTAVTATATYTVTASGGGDNATATISISIIKATPAITPATQSVNGTAGVAVTATTPYTAVNFAGTPSYTISPALPSGLLFASASGVITGTPTANSATTTYTVTATSGTDIATATITITVGKGTPAITPATQTVTGTNGTSLTATATYVAIYFTAAPTFTVTPALPAGLTIDSATGVIQGTPTVAIAATTYTVTATNGTEVATATISLTLTDKPKFPYAISFEANGGTGTMSGLTGTASSVTLPANTFTRTNYVFNGWKDDAGKTYTDKQVIEVKDSLSLALHAQWNSGATVTLTPASQTITGTVNSAITASAAYVATGFTAASLKYSISPALPNGLTFNTSTGVITGTPTAVVPLQQFTVTASDNSSTATATISISASTATVATKSIQPAVQTITGYVGVALVPSSSYTTSGFTGTLKYAISPALPAGLSINQTTGVISGTPASVMAPTNYVVTGSNSTESGTAAVSIQVVTGGASHLYAISFDPNGGQGVMPGLTGDAPSVVLSKNIFTLPSMTWTGWKDDNGKLYADGETVNVTQKLTLVLHAQWKLNETNIGDFSKPVPVVPGATQPVSFALNSNKLSAQSLAVLAKWNLSTVAAITISGFSQPGGGAAYNLKLSKQRAQSAASVMAKKYKGLKISIVGMGETYTKKCVKFKNKCAMITIMIMKDGRRA